MQSSQLIVDGLRPLKLGDAGREMVNGLPIQPIGDAYLKLRQVIQDIKTGDCHPGEAIDLVAKAGGNGVKPATAAGTAGGSAIFVRPLPNQAADFIR